MSLKQSTPLAEMMAKRGVGTSALSFRTGINSVQLARYKRSDRPNARNAAKIADVLHCRVEDLWPGVKLRE